MRGRRLLAAATALAVALLAGCASMAEEKRLTSLRDAMQRYGTLLRWGEYAEAAGYIRFREREPIEVDLRALERYRITAYDIAETRVHPGQHLAEVRVRIGFYEVDTGVVHTLDDRQRWWYNDELGRWFLDDTLPDFAAAARPR